MTRNQADEIIAGTMENPSETIDSLSQATQPESPKEEVKKVKAKQDSLYGDVADEDDFEDDEFQLEATDAIDSTGSLTAGGQIGRTKAKAMQSSKKTQFAAYQTEKNPVLYTKVGVGLFIPTFGAMFIREMVRQRKEEAYVKKGLEILEAQKAEYFNVTSTSEDSDLEDELKDLKSKDEEKDDDDDKNRDEEEGADTPVFVIQLKKEHQEK